MPPRKAKPTIIAKYSLEEIYIKKESLKAVFVCQLHSEAPHRSSIHAGFSYMLCMPHYISIPGGK